MPPVAAGGTPTTRERQHDMPQGRNQETEASEVVRSFVDAVNRQDWAQLTNLVDTRIRRYQRDVLGGDRQENCILDGGQKIAP